MKTSNCFFASLAIALILASCEKPPLQSDIESFVAVRMYRESATSRPEHKDSFVVQANGRTQLFIDVTLTDSRLDPDLRALSISVPGGEVKTADDTSLETILRPDRTKTFIITVGTVPGDYNIKLVFGNENHVILRRLKLTPVDDENLFKLSLEDTAGVVADGVSELTLVINTLGIQHPSDTMRLTLNHGTFQENNSNSIAVSIIGKIEERLTILSEFNQTDYTVTATLDKPVRSSLFSFKIPSIQLADYLQLSLDTGQGLLADGATTVGLNAVLSNGHPATALTFTTSAGTWEGGGGAATEQTLAEGSATAILDIGTEPKRIRVDVEAKTPNIRKTIYIDTRTAHIEQLQMAPSDWTVDSTNGSVNIDIYYTRSKGVPSSGQEISLVAHQFANGQYLPLGTFSPFPVRTGGAESTAVDFSFGNAYNDEPIRIIASQNGLSDTISLGIR